MHVTFECSTGNRDSFDEDVVLRDWWHVESLQARAYGSMKNETFVICKHCELIYIVFLCRSLVCR